MRPFCFLFLATLLVSVWSEPVNTGIKLGLSADVLNSELAKNQTSFLGLIFGGISVDVTPFNSTDMRLQVNSLSISDLSLASFSWAVSSAGLTMYSTQVSGSFTYNVTSWQNNKTIITGSGVFDDAKLNFTFKIVNQKGLPDLPLVSLQFNAVKDNINITQMSHNFTTNDSNTLKDIVANLVTVNASAVAAETIPPALSQIFQLKFGSGIFEEDGLMGFLNITFDYHLTEDVVFHEGYFTLALNGDIIVTNFGQDCSSFTKGHLPAVISQSTTVAVGIDTSVFTCLFYQVKDFATSLILSKVPGDGRITLSATPSTPTIKFEKDGTSLKNTINLAADITVTRSDTSVDFITLSPNISLVVNPVLDIGAKNSSILVNVLSLSIPSLSAKNVNHKDIPARYLNQIETENWPQLAQKFEAMAAKLFPISLSLAVPQSLQDLLVDVSHLSFETGENYVILKADLALQE